MAFNHCEYRHNKSPSIHTLLMKTRLCLNSQLSVQRIFCIVVYRQIHENRNVIFITNWIYLDVLHCLWFQYILAGSFGYCAGKYKTLCWVRERLCEICCNSNSNCKTQYWSQKHKKCNQEANISTLGPSTCNGSTIL